MFICLCAWHSLDRSIACSCSNLNRCSLCSNKSHQLLQQATGKRHTSSCSVARVLLFTLSSNHKFSKVSRKYKNSMAPAARPAQHAPSGSDQFLCTNQMSHNPKDQVAYPQRSTFFGILRPAIARPVIGIQLCKQCTPTSLGICFNIMVIKMISMQVCNVVPFPVITNKKGIIYMHMLDGEQNYIVWKWNRIKQLIFFMSN